MKIDYSVLASTPLFSIAFLKSLKSETPLVSMALTAETCMTSIYITVRLHGRWYDWDSSHGLIVVSHHIKGFYI